MDELTKLSNAALDKLRLEHPRYDRTALTPGIVHIGVGNFHRAHQAWYLHRLMQEGAAQDWAIIGAGVRPFDAKMREKLLAQDYLTTLIQLDPAETSAEVIGSMVDYLPIEDDNGALIAAMAEPSIRIVSLTVTESGYYLEPTTMGFDAAHPDMVYDAANPRAPRTAFGAMVEALRRRRAAGRGPFTGLSCDNLQGNGNVLKQTVTNLARLSDPELADWIAENMTFPNSMVDCIAPATGPKEHALVRQFGIDDAAPVSHEAHRQWVIEEKFCAGRPEWERVGVTFSDDVHAYETMKIRILNAGHQVLANIGEVLGLETISECMAHRGIAAMFRKVQAEEITQTVAPVPEYKPLDYLDLIEARFGNPLIVDTVRRVAFDGSARHPGFVLPILHDQLVEGRSVSGLALVEALWARMCEGTREDGSTIEANDPHWEALQDAAKKAKAHPQVWLEQKAVYGALAKSEPFAKAFHDWLELIWAKGAVAVVEDYVSTTSRRDRPLLQAEGRR
ncbi:mannitol dehydrogenase family protein [Lutimaribacter marinistellae]|uniref:Mannitol dehydrogenase family protein n=1 Tax=Lutimaribacter marinistellae TaxID=1820329 RepID=A0ABV7THP5_9RHOB